MFWSSAEQNHKYEKLLMLLCNVLEQSTKEPNTTDDKDNADALFRPTDQPARIVQLNFAYFINVSRIKWLK